jgi:uncharacterized protein (TIGR02678 family)
MNVDGKALRKQTALDSAREQAAQYEHRRALRALLQQPLLTADGTFAEEFALVRRHAEKLRDWLLANTGWGLHVTSELARLRKTPTDLDDATFGAEETRTRLSFSRRRYAVLCLALAALERSDRQTTLTILADSIVTACQAEPCFAANGITFDLSDQNQRRDLVAVVRFILDHQVIRRVHGDEEQYLQDERNNVLYTVNRPILSAMLCVQRGPSTVSATTFDERIAAISAEIGPDTEEAMNRRIRWRLTRRLLEQPVLYYQDLNDGERTYLDRQRSRILGHISEATGLIPEVRREGIAMLDETGDFTDQKLAENGTDGHLTLLLAEFLAIETRAEGGEGVGYATLRAKTVSLIAEHRRHWRRDVTEPGADHALTEMALRRMEALGLITRFEHGVQPRPAIARYSVGAVTVETEPTLFSAE